jgi:hypothetical protein
MLANSSLGRQGRPSERIRKDRPLDAIPRRLYGIGTGDDSDFLRGRRFARWRDLELLGSRGRQTTWCHWGYEKHLGRGVAGDAMSAEGSDGTHGRESWRRDSGKEKKIRNCLDFCLLGISSEYWKIRSRYHRIRRLAILSSSVQMRYL